MKFSEKIFNFCCCRKDAKVATTIFYCTICFDEGTVRQCCKSVICDYDYTKNNSCPICKSATKKEKVSGAVFMVPKYSEHEECRICLGPGLKRRCCGQYYCDDCYCKYTKLNCNR